MRIRDLKRKSGEAVGSCWPPLWASAHRPGRKLAIADQGGLRPLRRLGDVAAGMHRQGYDLQLTEYDERSWRATFYSSGMKHSATSAIGSAFESAPWTAVQRAAWEALALQGLTR